MGQADRPAGETVAERETLVVRRLGETLQTRPELMHSFAHAGVRPGARVEATRQGSGFRLDLGDRHVDVDANAASHVFVAAPEAR